MRKCLFILIVLPLLSTGQKYSVRKVNINTDLSSVYPTVMTLDNKGFIFLGTNKGVFKFDGINFKHLDSFHKKITALSFHNSKLMIGCDDGSIAEYSENKIKQLSNKNIQFNSEVSKIVFDEANNRSIYSSKGQGIIVSEENKTKFFSTKNRLSDDFVYGFEQNNNTIWAVTDKGVNKINLGRNINTITKFNSNNGLSDNIVSNISISPNKRKICLGYQQSNICVWDSALQKKIGIIINEKWGQINSSFFENDETIWLATEAGYILKVSVGLNRIYLSDSINIGTSISNIAKDIAGNIWVLSTQGLYEIVAPNISLQDVNMNSYNVNQVSAISNEFDSVLYFSIQNNLYRWSISNKQSQNIYSSKSIITKIFKTGDKLFLGTQNDGVWQLDIKQRNVEKISPSGLPINAHILDINSDINNLWIASLEGLYQCIKNPQNRDQLTKVIKHRKQDGLGSDYVYQIFIDRKKRVWFATDGAGPSVFENNKITSWKNKIPQLKSNVVYSITESADDKIWMTTLGEGILSFDGNKWNQFDKNYGINSNEFLGIISQPNWHIVSLQTGAIFEYIPKENFFRKYNKSSGIELDSMTQNLNLISENKEGDLLIPNRNGFILFKAQGSQNELASQIQITKVQVFLKDIDINRHEFNYDENQISFEFENTNFTNSEKLYYRYRLQGLSEQWITTNDKKITYSKLSSGNYIFEVQVAHNANFSNAYSDTFELKIASPFWQKWWFYLLLLVLTAYCIWLYVRFREDNIRKTESIRKERLNFEYEQLKSQINPHFLFNSLNTLVDLIDEDAERASDYTIHLAAMYRTLLSFRDKEVISIKDEIDLLAHFTFVQKCRFGEALQIEIDIKEHLAHKFKIVPLALQLLVENAIKHNEVSKANPLKISISVVGQDIRISNPLKPKMTEDKGEGFGISNLQTRYKLLAQKEIQISRENNFFVVQLPLL